ncbi:class C beta-lactamase-related serine hydrolase [Tardiphaga alba]|uniref:Class C beta-lactamase-related serine hydrolase n=2 Tax=Tardiphaga alba TaxID=340268 RepID=A0ABX8AGL5_9BRAD|nr:class C beta-lactamase-related serine hydrolase [Tardiphaga alba]
MSGFPSAPTDQVTLANWRTGPYNKWAFHHVRDIVPSADIANEPGNVWQLESRPADLSSLSFEHLSVRYSLDKLIGETDTDGLVILHRGKVIFEHYANGMGANTPHILMSVSKSMTALVAGILVAKGAIDPTQNVVSIIPELRDSVYSDATVRHVLDMRVGIRFDENYLATSGPIVEYRKSTGWNPLGHGESPSDLRSFLTSLKDREGPDNGPFHYVSPNSDLLGWIIERATGTRFADLMSKHLWQPMGAQYPAYVTVDRFGAPRCAGGICMTVMDLARVGQLMLQGGQRNGASIIPSAWIDDILANGDPAAWSAGDLAPYFGDRSMHYRNKWYVLRDRRMALGLGIHGQNIFVEPAKELVIAKMSSQIAPLDAALTELTLRFAEAVSDHIER